MIIRSNKKIFRSGLVTVCLIISAIAASKFLPKWWSVKSQASWAYYSATVHVSYQFNVLKHPTGLAIFPSFFESGTQYLFIADTGNHVIRLFKTYPGGNDFQIIAGSGSPGYLDGDRYAAKFGLPTGMLANMYAQSYEDGRTLEYFKIYVNDTDNNSVRKFCWGNGPPDFQDNSGCGDWTDYVNVYTVAGNPTGGFSDGSSLSARFNLMAGMAYDLSGQCYIADAGNHSIRMWDGYNVSTFAGTGSSGFTNGYRTSATFAVPAKMTQDSSGNMYVADVGNNAIRKIDASGYVTTCAGMGPMNPSWVDGQGTSACFSRPTSVAYNWADNMLYVADSHNNCIRRIDASGNVTTYAGTSEPGLVNGPLSQARFSMPTDLVISSQYMYISDSMNNVIRRIDMNTGIVSTYLQ
jgi:DNA-binding beta-propeller fold protein YncE